HAYPASRKFSEIHVPVGALSDSVRTAVRNRQRILVRYRRFLQAGHRKHQVADTVTGILGEPYGTVPGDENSCRPIARNQCEFFESVMIRGCAARTGWDKPRDPVRGMLSKPNRPVGSRGYSGRSALRRRDRIEICLLGAGGNPTDAILLRIGEPHRSAYRYGQALGEAFEIKIEMPECAVWLHQADHRCAVFCEPDARRTRRDSVWSMNS